MWKNLLFLGLVLILPCLARADVIEDVTASATWTAQGETFNASFAWDDTTDSLVAGSASYSITGPYGATGGTITGTTSFFASSANFGFPGGFSNGYVQIYDDNYSMVDGIPVWATPGTYSFSSNYGTGFFLSDPNVAGLGGIGIETGDDTLTVTLDPPIPTPESPTYKLVIVGVLAIAVGVFKPRLAA